MAWSLLNNPAASPGKVQRALVDIASGTELRRVLRDDRAWEVPPASSSDERQAELGAEAAAAPAAPAQAPRAPAPYATAASDGSLPSLRELVLQEEAASLREQLRRVQHEHRMEKAALHEQIVTLQGGGVDGAACVPWAELLDTLLDLCSSSLHQLQRTVAARPDACAPPEAPNAEAAAAAAQVRALRASLRECEEAVAEQAVAVVAARGARAEAGWEVAAERRIVEAEVRRREQAEGAGSKDEEGET